MISPFVYGRVVTSDEFLNRRKILRRTFSRIVKGESTALIGQPRTGKTSLLKFILDEKQRQEFLQHEDNRYFFRFIDSQMLGIDFAQHSFWTHVFDPFKTLFEEDIQAHYKIAEENQFGAFTLERLFNSLDKFGWRLVLLFDEFDTLLAHPLLNSAEFYGSLRSLASRYHSLVLIIATRRSLSLLNLHTQKLNPFGSPYFNIFVELWLDPLPHKDVAALLAQAKGVFNNGDRQFIVRVSGRHPYLLQAAADTLWDIHHDNEYFTARYQLAAEALYLQTQDHFADTWNSWSNAERKVVISIALSQTLGRIDNHTFLWSKLIEDIADHKRELRGLKSAGTIATNTDGDWYIAQEALLWWLVDDVMKPVIRDDTDFIDWLQAQELGNLLTKQEQQKIMRAINKTGGIVEKGAITLMESFAKGFGEGFGKATGEG